MQKEKRNQVLLTNSGVYKKARVRTILVPRRQSSALHMGTGLYNSLVAAVVTDAVWG